MAHRIGWYLDKRIAILHVEGEITLSQLIAHQAEVMSLVEDGNAPVHILLDMLEVTKHPTNLREVGTKVNWQPHPKVGWTIFITNNLVIRFLGSAMMQVIKQRVHAVSSVEAAINFLVERDQSLGETELETLKPTP